MKKTMIFAALMTFGVLAHAESVHVTITSTGTPLPVGEYTISTVPGSTSVVLVESAGKKMFKFGKFTMSPTTGKLTVELTGKPAPPVVTAGVIK